MKIGKKNNCIDNLIWLYGTSIIVGYLMQNPVFTYILNI